MNIKKILVVGILPIMWLAYFLFEVVTGRVNDMTTVIGNIFLILLFALVGYLFYRFTLNNPNGFSSKTMFILFLILMLLDQGIKIIIKFFFFNDYFALFNGFLSFNPIINTDGSWLNARFGTSVSFPLLIALNIFALIIFVEIYRYSRFKGYKDTFGDLSFLFIICGALCSLIDKVFYGGSLDFIGISTLFIADIKDIYINLGILFLIVCLYDNGFFKGEDDTSLKEDFKTVRKFFAFIISDIKTNLLKK